MKKAFVKYLLVAAWITATCTLSQAASDDALAASFQTPPDSARAQTWWHWMNGNVTAEGITKDLEAMKQAGLGGFQAFHVTDAIPAGPVGYDSAEWHALMAHTIREADRLGLEMCFHNCAGWSSSGGPWITPEHSMLEVVWSEQQLAGGQEREIALEQPASRLGYYRDIALLAFPTPAGEQAGEEGFRIENWKAKAGAGKGREYRLPRDTRKVAVADAIEPGRIIDLTDRMEADGRLKWSPTAGSWTIVRFGCTTTGKTNRPAPDEGVGLECDKLSKAGTDLHWNEIVKRVIDDAGPRTGGAFNNVLIDSFEVFHQNWMHGFAEQFKTRRGYDMILWMPCMTGRVVGDLDRSERFLWDLRRTIADLMDENYFGRFAELCHENGLVLSVEPYGNGGFDGFQAALTADIPMGEWWVNRPDAWHEWSGKLASSAAHIGGKRYVGAEAFTAGQKNAAWITHPYSIKAQGDYNYTCGVNRYIFHTFVHQPWPDDVLPGMTMGPHGMQMNRNNTWFLQARPWFDRLARCQYLLQEGRFVADLLYIYGEDAPNTNERRVDMSPVPPDGYDYDSGGFETLMKLSVKDGRLMLPSGMEYRMLVLTRMEYIRPELLEKIVELVGQGAVVVGEKPVASPSLENYPDCDKKVEALASSLWKKSRIHDPATLDHVLAGLKLNPDFDAPGEDGIEYIHRRIDGRDVYFVSNQSPVSRTVRCLFRTGGRMPELWHPDTGHIEPAAVWEPVDENRTAVTLDFDPAGSVFVVFDRTAGAADPIAEVVFQPLEKDSAETAASKIVRAWYGDPNDPQRRVDVTDAIGRRIESGIKKIVAGNTEFGDPAKLTPKVLVVEYTEQGEQKTMKLKEKDTLDLAAFTETARAPLAVVRGAVGTEVALVYEPGVLNVRRASGRSRDITIQALGKPVEVAGPWQVTFGPMGPGDTVEFKTLVPWNEHGNAEIRHYSGAAVYRTTFNVPDIGDAAQLIDLGNVQVMARVKLNGKDLGLLWKPPFRMDATGAIRTGKNELEITVVNLWVNRLIGDERYPDLFKRAGKGRSPGRGPAEIPGWLLEGRPRPATERKTVAAWRHWDKGDPLLPSGLIGPVRILRPAVVAIETGQ